METLACFIRPVADPKSQVAIVTIFFLILLDLLVGIVGAIATHTFSSEKMRAGLLHKFMEMCAIALSIILDGALLGGIEITIQPLVIGTCVYIGIMETGSILELIKKYDPEAEGLVGFLTSFVAPKDARQEQQPVAVMVTNYKQKADPDATTELPRHYGGE